jgi:hypothetical protein
MLMLQLHLALMLSTLRTIRLAWCLAYPPPFLFKLSQFGLFKFPDYRSCPTYFGACFAWSLRDVTGSIIYIVLQLSCTLPTLIIVGENKDIINGYGANGESAGYGVGWGL